MAKGADLRGVNYWPRFLAGIDPASFNGQSWLDAGQYDPDIIEADLTEIAALSTCRASLAQIHAYRRSLQKVDERTD